MVERNIKIKEKVKHTKNVCVSLFKNPSFKTKTHLWETARKAISHKNRSINWKEILELLNTNEEVKRFFKSKNINDELKIFNYVQVASTLYELYEKYPELKYVRGLVVNKNGEIIASGYEKFFNLNENKYTTIESLKEKAKYIEVKEKIDGVMITGFEYKGKLYLTTKSSSQGKFIEDAYKFIERNSIYVDLIRDAAKYGFCCIFEYVNPKYPISIEYDKEDLILTGIKNPKTGSYVRYDILDGIKKIYCGTSVVKLKLAKEVDKRLFALEINSIQEKLNKVKEYEGEVVYIEDNLKTPYFVKIKTPWYLKTFKIITTLNSAIENNTPIYVIDSIINGTFDDIYANISNNKIKEKMNLIRKEFLNISAEIYNKYNANSLPKNMKQKIEKLLTRKKPSYDEFINDIYPYYRQYFSKKIKERISL